MMDALFCFIICVQLWSFYLWAQCWGHRKQKPSQHSHEYKCLCCLINPAFWPQNVRMVLTINSYYFPNNFMRLVFMMEKRYILWGGK
jgi:hypothetical protein